MIDNDAIISFLSDFVTERRRNKIEEILNLRTRYITVVLEDIYQSQNTSAVLRTCECLGIQDVHIIENYNSYNINPMVLKGSDKWLTIRRYNRSADNSAAAIGMLKSEGYRIVATSLHDKSIALPDFDLDKGKCAVVFGNEHQGVSKYILREADEYLKIPMCGFTQSFNISVSVGIVIFQLMQKLSAGAVAGYLTDAEKKTLRAEWLKSSVKNPQMLMSRFKSEEPEK